MENLKITHTSKDQIWHDETGNGIPLKRVTKVERLHEKSADEILKKATEVNRKLADFKAFIQDKCTEAYEAFMEAKDVKKETKGNYTWFNFNRTIKIEVSQSAPIKFDDLTIVAAKEKLDQFLNDNINSKNEFVKDLVMDAFETQRTNQLDVKKVMGLTRHKARINDPLFSEAIDLITSAIRRPESKTYFRIWVKDENGKYNNIELNLSNI